MATVFNVAKYILKHQGEMTTMKLQKLVYYCQAWALAWDEIPLFDEEFQAWANGPVCPELFECHRGLFLLNENFLAEYPDYEFKENEVDTMNSVLSYYGNREPYWLSELTHKEAPWKEARKGFKDGEACNIVISKESMQQYYGGL